jgi:hypothetical protein
VAGGEEGLGPGFGCQAPSQDSGFGIQEVKEHAPGAGSGFVIQEAKEQALGASSGIRTQELEGK